MRLTALDIREQQFRRVMRGLDPDEVMTFLGSVANEYEQLVAENRDLRQRLLDLEHQLGEFRSMEKALRDTLLTAERVTAETKENAQKEADLILRHAEVAAQQSTAHISSEILQKRRELVELQRKKKDYLFGVRALAQSHLAMVESDARALDQEYLAAREPGVAVPGVDFVPGGASVAATPPAPSPAGVRTEIASGVPQDQPVVSEVPTEAGGMIPSAVPMGESDPRLQGAEPSTSPPQGGWAEAAFDPVDLVPRNADATVMTDRTAELYRRGIQPDEQLPSLLRSPGSELPATVAGPVPQTVEPGAPVVPELQPDGENNWPTQAVRPDGSQGE